MKNKQFYDETHAQNSLLNSIIRYRNKPIYIRDVQTVKKIAHKNFRIMYSTLGDEEYKILFFPSESLNFNPVPLGMMNIETKTFYIQRLPSRGYKIGLCSNNISPYPIGEKKETLNRNFDDLLKSKELLNCIMGKYDSYNKALDDIIKGTVRTSAFSRRFAIDNGSLVFKTIDSVIGICEKRQPILFDKYQYLNEVLEEDLNAPNN